MHTRRVTAAIAALLYVASLLLPAGEVVIKHWTPSGPFHGYAAFLVALMMPLHPSWEDALLFASWLANPVFFLGVFWCLKGRTARAAKAGAISAVLCLAIFPLARDMVAGWPGYWVWLASFLTLLAGSVLELIAARGQAMRNGASEHMPTEFSGAMRELQRSSGINQYWFLILFFAPA